eukprot:TRINITY_DN6072_c0_g1_i6.p1 TRINITY_DN6072_c0_g1~~TRINITY_DN6072_c0_g1_i6.p1  ORF type:complete len:574 (+),score=52.14 TRINITY_DN6072_c0_g1_i6:61-1722(+)
MCIRDRDWMMISSFAVFVALWCTSYFTVNAYQRDKDERTPKPEIPKLWPRPRQVTFGAGRSELPSPCDLKLVLPETLKFFQEYDMIFEHYRWKIFKRVDCVAKLNTQFNSVTDDAAIEAETFTISVQVKETTKPGYLTLTTSENYTLSVDKREAKLTADTYFGFVRGLETLSQLIHSKSASDGTTNFYIPGTPVVITDYPLTRHRGIMLDTARHFLSLRTLRRMIDAMMYNKMNVLHWHIIDADSFPLFLEKKPQVTLTGAFTPHLIYKPTEIKEFVEYARVRGVRVIAEIESPGHTRSWGLTPEYADILSCPITNGHCAQPPCGQISLLSPKTIELMTEVIAQVKSLFQDEVVHFGADEIKIDCWESDSQYNGKNVRDLCISFQKKQRELLGKDKKAMYWGDSLYLGEDGDIIQFWNSFSNIPKRYKVISYSGDFYLDCGLGNLNGQDGVWCGDLKTWKHILSRSIKSELEDSMFLGAENTLFGEMNNDATTDVKVWPRASATAELLWSGTPEEAAKDTQERLFHQVSRLWWRGIASTPVTTTYCTIHPDKC